MKNKNNLIYGAILIVGLIVIGAGGYLVFHASSKQNDPPNLADNSNSAATQNGSGSGWQGRGGNGGTFKPLHGTVSGVNGSTISMKADDGSSKSVICDSSTRINKMDNGQRVSLSTTDIKEGDEINVMASDTTQSEIKARMVIIGTFSPASRGTYGGGGGYQGSGSSSSQSSSDESSSQI